MAKIKLAKRNAVKPSVADWSKAVPCFIFLFAAFAIVIALLYFAMTSSIK